MLNVLHISDLHFGKCYFPAVGEALLRMAKTMDPDVVIISGDMTQRAKRREFIAAQQYIADLPAVPHVVVPGNHDIPLYRFWERLWQPHGLYRQYICKDLNPIVRLDQAVIVGLDSTSPYRAISNGRLSKWQLRLCAEAFADVPPEVYRIVVTHHHFAPAPDYDRSEVMPMGKRAVELFTSLKVDLILAGHQHRAYVGNSLDVYAGKDRTHGIIIGQCGTTTSRRGRAREQEKNSFNWVQITEPSIRVLHYVYFTERQGFAPTSQHEFARPSQAYLRLGVTPKVVE